MPGRDGDASAAAAERLVVRLMAVVEVVFGARVRHPLSWLAVLAYVSVWSRMPGRRHSPTTRTEE